MTWRFRKRIKLLPGLWINLSKGAPSLSIGGKGVTTNIGKKGVATTLGVPGTGLSYRFGPKRTRKKSTQPPALPPTHPPAPPNPLAEKGRKFLDIISKVNALPPIDEQNPLPGLQERVKLNTEQLELVRQMQALRPGEPIERVRKKFKDDDTVWNRIFSGTLQYRQTKGFNYIVDRTLNRPREIIQFCTTIVEENATSGIFPIDYDIISKAELTYSEDRTKDIASEYHFQYPGLMSVFEVFRGRTYTLDRDELEFLCLQLSEGEHTLSNEGKSWIQGQEPSYIIEALWRIGFLRAQAVGGVKTQRRSGSSYLGPHQVANLSLHNLARFHVHPMFRSYLGNRKGDGAWSF